MVPTNTMSRSRLSRCATEEKVSAAISSKRVEQEVHPPTGRQAWLSVNPPRRSIATRSPTQAGRRQLRPRFQGALRDQREHHPLSGRAVTAPTGGDPADRRTDPEPLPEPVQRPCPTQAAGIEDLDLGAVRGSHRLLTTGVWGCGWIRARRDGALLPRRIRSLRIEVLPGTGGGLVQLVQALVAQPP